MYKKQNQYDLTIQTQRAIQKSLNKAFQERLGQKSVFLAIDGFIDSLYTLVKTREDKRHWQEFKTIKSFAERLNTIAGSSGNIELILKKKESGGFAPNNAKALAALGIELFLLGALGYPQIKPVYDALCLNQKINIKSIANPAKTIGLEFHDGKLMMSDMKSLFDIDWELITQRFDEDKIIKQMEKFDAIGFGYWSIIPKMTQIWEKISIHILPSIKNRDEKLFFVDLADIKKRQKRDIVDMIETLQKIDAEIPVLLSLNDQEAVDISKSLGSVMTINPNKKKFEDFVDAGKRLNKKLKLSYVVIHSPHFATITLKDLEEHYWITGGFTSEPSYTVSAGDHFLSGVIAGLLGGLNPPEAILLGNALTAIFVRTGDSPTFPKLNRFVENYMKYILEDLPKLV